MIIQLDSCKHPTSKKIINFSGFIRANNKFYIQNLRTIWQINLTEKRNTAGNTTFSIQEKTKETIANISNNFVIML